MKMSLFVIMMVLVNSAFAGEEDLCGYGFVKDFAKSLNKNGVASVCVHIQKSHLLNDILNCYESRSGLTIDHMINNGNASICIAVSRSKTK